MTKGRRSKGCRPADAVTLDELAADLLRLYLADPEAYRALVSRALARCSTK
jgi:hypothetical protein